MNILYIHQYFKTPREPGGTRSYWIAQELIKSGHQVTMITADPKAIKKRNEVIIGGINVVYLQEAYSQNMSISMRLKSFLGFAWKSITEARKQKDIDLVIATSTPLTVGITALYMKWFKKVPFIFEVRDLWPEVPIQMGGLNNWILQRVARWFERKIYTSASHVVALSPGMQDGVIKYISNEKTSMIPNMAKIDQFWPRQPNIKVIEELGLKSGSFKVIHFGSLGMANGAEYIVDAANLIRNVTDVEFIFLGGGSTEEALQNKCRQLTLNNIKFLGKYPMDKTSEIVNFCDVSLVSFMDLPILYTNSPNKLFDSLSAGKPVVVNSAGWTKEMVEQHKCGFFVDPTRPEELADRIMFLKQNSTVREEMGKNARILAESKYDKTILCKQFAGVVERFSQATRTQC